MSTFAWARRMAKITLLAAVFAASGTGVALAGDTTSGDGGVLSGNQVNVPVSIPISVCGNAIAVLGEALGVCSADAPVGNAVTGPEYTSGDDSLLSGNQLNAPVNVPVDVCGNAIAALGKASAHCDSNGSAAGSALGGYRSHGGHGDGGDHGGHGGHGSLTGGVTGGLTGGLTGGSGLTGHGDHGDGKSRSGHKPCDKGSSSGEPGDNDKKPGSTGHHGHAHGSTGHHGRGPGSAAHHRTPDATTHQAHQPQLAVGAPTQLSSRMVSSDLPTTGANLTSLLALAGVAIALGAGALVVTGRRPRRALRHGRAGSLR